MSVSPPRFRYCGGAVVSPALLHAPPPLRLPLAVDEDLRGAELLQEFLLYVFRFDPSLLLLPVKESTQCVKKKHKIMDTIMFLLA